MIKTKYQIDNLVLFANTDTLKFVMYEIAHGLVSILNFVDSNRSHLHW